MKKVFPTKFIFAALISLSSFSYAQSQSVSDSVQMEDLIVLAGLWQISGKSQFEEWRYDSIENQLSGKSYKMENSTPKLLETLSIEEKDGTLVYTATVLNQNEGQSIPFILNPDISTKFSFENLNHDFPNKIQYTIINQGELQVDVLGGDDQGFSLKLVRQ